MAESLKTQTVLQSSRPLVTLAFLSNHKRKLQQTQRHGTTMENKQRDEYLNSFNSVEFIDSSTVYIEKKYILRYNL